MQGLIRFPYENVIHDFRPPLNCSKTRIHYDYEAFEVDADGRLQFTRTFGKEQNRRGVPPRYGDALPALSTLSSVRLLLSGTSAWT